MRKQSSMPSADMPPAGMLLAVSLQPVRRKRWDVPVPALHTAPVLSCAALLLLHFILPFTDKEAKLVS